ncbi:hypothetical protein ACN28I_30765 [Archangium gephyra]|uniref:hypothetical protein n=1 Tax=Archangium gephyra TaxID=48 RepID=UPI003B81D5F3
MGARPLRFVLGGGLLLLLVAPPVGYYLYLKRVAAQRAEVLGVDWNPSRTCSITTYVPSLGENSASSRFFRLFSSRAFFRVHDAQGRLLRSSEWLLLQNEADDEPPRWVSEGQVVYPTSQGYEGWALPECGPE